MKTIRVGLVKGRHEMPAEDYIFDADVDPMDFEGIDARVISYLSGISGLIVRDEDPMFPYYPLEDNIKLTLYVTGLSAALAAVIRWCAKFHINLTLMHFDRDSGEYKPQPIF